jgi:23S rRNA pseudouridine2605 synthase
LPSFSLCRILSKSGICSRSKAADLIRSGRVKIDGRDVTDPDARFDISRIRIEIDGNPVRQKRPIYLMLNKPAGFVTTASDEHGRKTVYNLLDMSQKDWIAPVGRLDKDSEGLLLFTNDSVWAAGITDPSSSIRKTYHVRIDRKADEALCGRLLAGITDRDEFLSVKSASLLRSGEKNSWLEIVLDEGKNRHIRRMMDALGIRVLRLVRVSIGGLKLGALPKSASRALTNKEIDLLRSG